MAVMPDVKFLGFTGTPKMARWDVVCVHTIVGFQKDGNLRAHFTTGADGNIVQARDTKLQSTANRDGNHRVIAIENEDFGDAFGFWNTKDGHAVPGFTNEQCEAIAKICAWAHKTHDIPLVLCPDSRKNSRGIAYHRQGIGPNPFHGFAFKGLVPGGELWSFDSHKVCPGDRRIKQLIETILPRARVLAGQAAEDDMYSDDDRKMAQSTAHRVEALVKAFTSAKGGPNNGETIPMVLMLEAAAWRLHRSLQLDPTLKSGVPVVDNGEALPLVDLLRKMAADIAELKAKVG